jgi:hypothetical protein
MERHDDFEIPFTLRDRLRIENTANEVVGIREDIKELSTLLSKHIESSNKRVEKVEVDVVVAKKTVKLFTWIVGGVLSIYGTVKAFF